MIAFGQVNRSSHSLFRTRYSKLLQNTQRQPASRGTPAVFFSETMFRPVHVLSDLFGIISVDEDKIFIIAEAASVCLDHCDDPVDKRPDAQGEPAEKQLADADSNLTADKTIYAESPEQEAPYPDMQIFINGNNFMAGGCIRSLRSVLVLSLVVLTLLVLILWSVLILSLIILPLLVLVLRSVLILPLVILTLLVLILRPVLILPLLVLILRAILILSLIELFLRTVLGLTLIILAL